MQLPLDMILITIALTCAGTVLAGVLAFMPGFHVYNLMGLVMLFSMAYAESIPGIYIAGAMIGMMLGFVMYFSSISTLYFQAPDDSTMFFQLPTQRYLMQGKAHAAVILGGVGSLLGCLIVVGVIPLIAPLVRLFDDVFRGATFFLIGVVICFIIMSEWPKDFGQGQTKWQRLRDGWSTLLWGYFIFALSGILGMINFWKPLIPTENAFQSLLPIFVGLFAIPAILTNLISQLQVPPQYTSKSVHLRVHHMVQSGFSGGLGGMFGAIAPGVTAGPAGLMSGHATAQSGENNFLMSMNVTRIVYFVGAMTLMMNPAIHLRRGGASVLTNLFYVPSNPAEYYVILSGISLAAFLAFILLLLFSRMAAKFVQLINFKYISIGSLILLLGIVVLFTSWQGLAIMIVATSLGLTCILFQTRRLNLLAVLLVPLFLNMSGAGGTVAKFLGLI